MQRNHILALIIAGGLFTTTTISLWSLQAYLTSRPVNLTSHTVKAASQNYDDQLSNYPSIAPNSKLPIVNTRRYLLLHKESGKVLLSRDADKPVPVASTTKIMTARLVLRESDLDTVVTVPREALVIGSSMGLKENVTITVENLLYGMMLVSGNDAANTLAYYVGQKLLDDSSADFDQARERFILEMNKEAATLNLTETNYKDPAGLNDEGQGSARDLAKLMLASFENPVLKKVTTTAEITVTDTSGTISYQLKNSNRLVSDFSYSGSLIGKTGFTPEAGHCLVASAQRNGSTYIVVILSTYDQTVTASAQEARKLLDWAFSNVEVKPLSSSAQAVQPVPTQSGRLAY